MSKVTTCYKKRLFSKKAGAERAWRSMPISERSQHEPRYCASCLGYHLENQQVMSAAN